MSQMTPEEWKEVQAALVRGDLQSTINELLRSRVVECEDLLNDYNRALIYRAYDDGDGKTVTLVPSDVAEGYFIGLWDGDQVVEGTEIDGTVYLICAHSGGGTVTVVVGEEVVENVVGPVFHTSAEARAYIQGLTAQS